jgi:hypothetical protein
MTRKARAEHRLVRELSVLEVAIAPATGRSILLRVFDHELKSVLRRTRDVRLSATERAVVLLGRENRPGQARDDRTFGERELPLAVRLDCDLVAENGPNVVELAFLTGDRDQLPVSVSARDVLYVGGGRLGFPPKGDGNRRGGASKGCDDKQQDGLRSHTSASSMSSFGLDSHMDRAISLVVLLDDGSGSLRTPRAEPAPNPARSDRRQGTRSVFIAEPRARRRPRLRPRLRRRSVNCTR